MSGLSRVFCKDYLNSEQAKVRIKQDFLAMILQVHKKEHKKREQKNLFPF
jgi:hypothetical protein